MSRAAEPPGHVTPADLTALLAEPSRASELSRSSLVSILEEIADKQARLGALETVVAVHLALATRGSGSADGPRPKLLVDAVTHILPFAHARIYELIRTGELAAIKIGKNLVIDPDDLQEFCDRNRLPARPDAGYMPRGVRRSTTGAKAVAPQPGARAQTRRRRARSDSTGSPEDAWEPIHSYPGPERRRPPRLE
jgi:hypothetical protein